MSFTLDTPEQIAMWRVLSAESMLALEVNTGMKAARYSVLNACRDNGWTHKATKKGALLDLIGFRRVLDPEYTPSDLTTRSLDPKKVAAALRKADKFAKRLSEWTEGEPQIEWVGV